MLGRIRSGAPTTFAGALAVLGVITAPARLATAAPGDLAPVSPAAPAVPPPAVPGLVGPPAPTPAPPSAGDDWRRAAFPAALALAGVGLAGGIGFMFRANERTNAFNEHSNVGAGPTNERCAVARVDNGGPECDAMLSQVHSAQRWSKVGFAMAGTFAVAALVLKLTESELESAQGSKSAEGSVKGKEVAFLRRLVCVPGLGASASCAFTF
jgi:hypothetical protein